VDTAPASRDDVLPWLRLTAVPGVSPAMQRSLLKAFETPQGVAHARHNDIAAVTGSTDAAAALAKGPASALIDATLRWLERPGCRLVTLADCAYPRMLLQTADPPAALYAQGHVELLNAEAFAIVGSRNATPQGACDALALATALSESGFTIVSGLALGIDAAAHRGGLAGAGSSIAVMGTGPDIIYPRRNHALAHALAAQGCLVSEFPLGTPPLAGNFPRRNRLISGLARGVLVVEAALKSGSLITARSANEQGRDVFAIPGSIHSPLSKGCHWLIKEGAKLVEGAEDLLVELGREIERSTPQSDTKGSGDPDPVLQAMGFAPTSIDQMAQRTGLDAAKLAAHLSRLEIAGRIEAWAGGWFQRVRKRVIE
jgi:DNA processing protein